MGRRGQMKRIVFAVACVVVLQGLYIASFNIARKNDFGLVMMYAFALVPIFAGVFLLSGAGDYVRRRFLYNDPALKVEES
jgi:hypothetical protein